MAKKGKTIKNMIVKQTDNGILVLKAHRHETFTSQSICVGGPIDYCDEGIVIHDIHGDWYYKVIAETEWNTVGEFIKFVAEES